MGAETSTLAVTLPPESAGWRLDRALAAALPQYSRERLKLLISAGHVNFGRDPAAKVKGYRQGVRCRCFLTDGERLILPAFGAYAGGLNVLDEAFGGLFAERPSACALGRDRVHLLNQDALLPD